LRSPSPTPNNPAPGTLIKTPVRPNEFALRLRAFTNSVASRRRLVHRYSGGGTRQFHLNPLISSYMFQDNIDYVIFDVETTGMKAEEGHAIVELAAQRVHDRQVVDVFDTIVNPGKKIDKEAEAVHGISNELVKKDGKALIEVIPAFVLFANGATLVAHNIGFDLSFINKHLKDLKLPTLTNPIVDTLQLAREKVVVGSYSLAYLARHFNIPQPKAHRALVDVDVTRQLLFKLLDLKK